MKLLKNLCYLVFFVSFGFIGANEHLKHIESPRYKKIYVQKCLKNMPTGFIVGQNNRFYFVKNIFADKHGLFFLRKNCRTKLQKGKGRYECDICNKTFSTQLDLLWHIHEVHR